MAHQAAVMGGGSVVRSTPSSNNKIDGRSKISSGGGMSMPAVLSEVSKEGWMRKKGSRVNMWGERYFVLKGSYLYYFLKSIDAVSATLSLVQTCACMYCSKVDFPLPTEPQTSTLDMIASDCVWNGNL